ncbi:penicillin-binding transpeptidase domain-containing protein [Nocardioides terrisoli]|uniref:penicillin-binding transpeptidase domain-containing protein n=1 Tax=Nocardioides terrisoli TaxID=3388267 RepID=UPI00287BC681|nr:penicillin-binding transpeptidase domain-containing protein [Nocardioides marmorisolisilvae]
MTASVSGRSVRTTAVAATTLLLGTLAGCSLPGGGPSAGDAATKVAHEFATGEFTDAVFNDSDKAQQAYRHLVAGLGNDLKPMVSVKGTNTSGNNGTATLSWSWPLDEKSWTYTSTVPLHRSGDAWLATWSPRDVVPGLSSGDRLVAVRVDARRGDILGAGGAPLVKPRAVVRYGIDRTRVKKAASVTSARRLAALLGIDAGRYTKLVRSSGPRAFIPALTLRKQDVTASVRSGVSGIPGAVGVPGTLPLAPTKDFAAPLLGTVGQATAEIVKRSKGRVRPGDVVGLSGLQLRYDEQLAGRPGTRIDAVDAKGGTRKLFESAPVPGKPLRLTLVPRLQRLAEQVLAPVRPASALVAIRPSTGAILAAASGPGSHGYDTATYGRYAPGSTFKIVSSLALLRSGLTPQSKVHCVPELSVDGKRFTNDSEYPPSGLGDIPLTLALANSCNTGYISQHGRLHNGDLTTAAAALGFGVDHQVGFPAYFGQAPKPASETEGAADMIGQGKVLASPMAMATVVASVVAGHAVLPELVQGIDVQKPAPLHPLTAKEAGELRAMMRAVVTTPTGTGAGLADVPGKPVIAKTGTAEFGSTPPLDTHAWMVAGQGDLAVAVFVDRGHTGAGTAGPVLESFLRGK